MFLLAADYACSPESTSPCAPEEWLILLSASRVGTPNKKQYKTGAFMSQKRFLALGLGISGGNKADVRIDKRIDSV